MAQADHITQTNGLQTHIKSLEVRTVLTACASMSLYLHAVCVQVIPSVSGSFDKLDECMLVWCVSIHFPVSLLCYFPSPPSLSLSSFVRGCASLPFFL